MARTLGAWGSFGQKLVATVERTEINGQPGALVLDREGRIMSAISLTVVGDRIGALHGVVNPEKLAHLGTPAGGFS